MKQSRKITDQEYVDAYNEYRHCGKIAAHFKVPHIQAWRRCKALGLDFPNDGNNGKGRKVALEEILEGKHPHFQTLKLKKKLLEAGIFENECHVCGIREWNGQSLVMQLDHINGDPSDHVLTNLRMLCPNCHAQTDTFCGKNKC
jgi:hypothetical protein